jgi:succinoglycan biosynthesis transport protein ExoP
VVQTEKNDAARAVPRDRSVLRAHVPWILAVVLVAVAGAGVLAWALHDPAYSSEVRILVNPALTPAGSYVPPDMETERQVVVSGVVTAGAATETGTSPTYLQRASSVDVPAASTVLVLTFHDETAALAQRRAQAIADAYIAYRNGQAEALSLASLPPAVSGPNYPVDLAAGLAVGLILGIGSALLRDRIDDRLRGPRDFVEQANVPLLAMLPVPRRLSSKRSGLVVLHEPESAAAEAYRQIRGKITRAAGAGGGGTAVTVVTSAAVDDGAALVAANTAVALTRSGCQVLLIEANMHVPRMGQIFEIPEGGGLRSVLSYEVPLVQALRASRVNGLRILTAGKLVPSAPGDLFDERAVGRLLSEVPADIDHVVVHAPPVLCAAETLLLAQHAQVEILVATTSRTTRQDVRVAVAELATAPGALLGGVLRRPGWVPRRRRSESERHAPSASPARPVLSDPQFGRPQAPAADNEVRPLSRDRIPPVTALAPGGGPPAPTEDGGAT